MKKINIKENLNEAKKGILKGIALLFVTYLFLYSIGGEEAYAYVILKLTDVNVLIKQLIVFGIAGYIEIFFALLLENSLQKRVKQRENKQTVSMKQNFKNMFSQLIYILVITIFPISLMNVVYKNDVYMCTISVITWLFYIILNMTYVVIKNGIDEARINKKIKEINKNIE